MSLLKYFYLKSDYLNTIPVTTKTEYRTLFDKLAYKLGVSLNSKKPLPNNITTEVEGISNFCYST